MEENWDKTIFVPWGPTIWIINRTHWIRPRVSPWKKVIEVTKICVCRIKKINIDIIARKIAREKYVKRKHANHNKRQTWRKQLPKLKYKL